VNFVPNDNGFTMPAEWMPHASVWTAYPADNLEWLGHLEAVRSEFAAFIKTVSNFELVNLIVRDEETEVDARARLEGAKVVFHRFAHNDVWLRDCAPIFVTREHEVAAVDWEFNGWGMKFDAALDNQIPDFVSGYLEMPLFKTGIVMEGGSLEVNGAGVALTTRQCLHSKFRNPKLSELDLEKALHDYLGIKKVLWLENGLEGDHTDGHIDTITRFIGENTIITSVCEDPNDANFQTMQDNLECLKSFTNLHGQPFTILELPLPHNRLEHLGEVAQSQGLLGERLPPTYANFYIANGAVIVPMYGDPNDQRALEILTPLFPDRQVIGLSSRAIINGGGSFHCVTQQQPAGQIAKLEL
jgi:agmatine deiminase